MEKSFMMKNHLGNAFLAKPPNYNFVTSKRRKRSNSWCRFFIKTWNRLFAISLDDCSFICFRKQICPEATITEIKEKRSSFSPFFLSILIVVLLFALIRKQTWTDRYTTSCTMLLMRTTKGLLMFLRYYRKKVDKAASQKENQPIKEALKLMKMLNISNIFTICKYIVQLCSEL